jgi:glycosyltransferase involved in cell wall biosynthesis
MQDATLVTVICSCYNHNAFVIESIQSVLNQTYKNIQLIVVDDGSNDNSVAVIENFIQAYPEIIFINNKTNLGLTTSVTNAMRYAKGAYFIDLAADDVLLPNCIEIQLNTFQKSSLNNLAIVYGNAELITEDGKHASYYFDVDENLKTKTKRPSGDIYSNVISATTTICSVSSMCKKDIFDKLNGYDTSLSYEDFDLWIRISREYTIEFVDAILIQKRILANSLQTTLYATKSSTSYSTYTILKKAYRLNRNKKEHQILTKRVNFEILNAFRTNNYFLMLKNIYLRFLIGLKSI